MSPPARVSGPSKAGRATSETREQAIIGGIYDAALDTGRWPSALAALSEYAGLREAFIALVDLRTMSFPLMELAHFAPEAKVDFLENWATPERNLWVRAGTTVAPLGASLNMDRLVPRRQLERTDHYHDLLVPWHVERCVGCPLFRVADAMGVYSAYRSAREPDIDQHDEALLDRFVSHLGRSLEIHRRFRGVEAAGRQALEALHHLELGVVLLDGDGRVLFSNRSAAEILGSADGLTASAGRLVASAADDQARLARMVFDVTCTGQRRGLAAGGALLLARPSGKRALSVLIAPLGDNPFRLGARVPVAVVFLSDPERARSGTLRLVAQRYHLTPQEIAVAGLVASGAALPAVAGTLGVSLSTARTHLYRVFDKVGVRRQAELVKLVLTEPGALGLDPRR
jgi:DNA-binding CsgD family transcriptional regulator/PAS domain-containing protein